MKLHVLKIKEKYLWLVTNGSKKAELRKDDRDFEPGDLIHFVDVRGKEFDMYEKNLFVITSILRNAQEYGLLDGYAMLSIEQIR